LIVVNYFLPSQGFSHVYFRAKTTIFFITDECGCEKWMNANDDIINLILDRTAYQVEPLSRYAGWVCPVSPGYLDTGHNEKNRYLRPSRSCSYPLLSAAKESLSGCCLV